MHISYDDGLSKEGLILTLAGAELRAAIRGAEDPAQFTLVGGSWFAEDGRKATFEFPLGVLGSQEFLVAIQEVTVEGLNMPRACSSGGECMLKRMSSDPLSLN
jgi:hypothetical protein